MNKYKLSQKDCLELTNHCFELVNYTLACYPPITPEICKHCGLIRYSTIITTYRYCNEENSTKEIKK